MGPDVRRDLRPRDLRRGESRGPGPLQRGAPGAVARGAAVLQRRARRRRRRSWPGSRRSTEANRGQRRYNRRVPEGDTIHRSGRPAPARARGPAARALRGAAGRRPAAGRRARAIEAVEAVGKHLLVRFADGLTLRTHLRMTGSWHLYRTGERWRKAAAPGPGGGRGRRTGWRCASRRPVVELELPAGRRRIAHLGPDLAGRTSPTPTSTPPSTAWPRAPSPTTRSAPSCSTSGSRAGVGNVYKSEVLFACGVDPFTPVGPIDERTRRRLLDDGREAAAGQPRPARRPHHRRRRAGRLRPPRPAVPPLRHADPLAPPGRAGPQHLLVPDLPAVTGAGGPPRSSSSAPASAGWPSPATWPARRSTSRSSTGTTSTRSSRCCTRWPPPA